MKKVFLLFIIAFALAGCVKQESIAKEVEITTPQQIEQTETSEIVVESTDKEIITKSTESIEDIIIVDTELSEGTTPTEPPAPYYKLLEMEEKGRDIITNGKFEEDKIK